jgi:AraC-like DNA-binding protein
MNYRLNTEQDWLKLGQQANWSVAGVAKLCGSSVRMLQRHFHQTFGESPKTWLKAQRQKKAKELLRDHTTVKETASLVGYANASTFAREFKKQSGQCPSVLVKPPAQSGIAKRNVA